MNRLSILLALSLAGCGGVTIPPCILDGTCLPSPKPTPTPTPVPTPTPTPTPTPIPTPRPTPTPSTGGDIAQGVQWSVVGTKWPSPDRPAPMFSDRIDGIMAAMTGCNVNSDCATGMTMCQFHTTVIGKLRAESLFAGWQDGVCANDEIAVGLRPDLVQGYHIYNEGGGKVVWSTGANWEIGKGAYRDTWKSFDTDPTPPPAEPPTTPVVTCPDTPPANTGTIHSSIKPAKQDQTWNDFTPKLNDRDWCSAHYGPSGPWPDGRMLVVCALRPEGHPERRACDYALGTPTWSGADPAEGDPFHATAGRGVGITACVNGSCVTITTP